MKRLVVLLLLAGCTATSHPAAVSNHDVPDHSLTPGAVFPSATAAQVCVHGYTATVRNVPMAERRAVFKSYRVPYADHAKYEVDHLISLELGGSNEQTNLWPEPYAGTRGARVKDKVENRLHALVCSGKLSLASAQRLIASDWEAALAQYG